MSRLLQLREHDNRNADEMLDYREAQVEALQRRVKELEDYIAVLEAPEVYGQVRED